MADNSINSYYNLVNQNTSSDELGDAFLRLADKPAKNGKDQFFQSFMAGLGGGFKASAAKTRQKKLADLEAMLGQAGKIQADLQTQLGQNQLNKQVYTNFGQDVFANLRQTAIDIENGDEIAADSQFGTIFNRFKSKYPEQANGLGDYDHYNNGRIYLRDKNGNVNNYLVKDVLQPIIATMVPEQQEELGDAFNLLPVMRNFEDQRNMTLADLAKKEADADLVIGKASKIPDERMNIQADTAETLANTRLKDLEYNAAMDKAENSPQYSDNAIKTIENQNLKYTEDLRIDKMPYLDTTKKMYQEMQKIINSPEGKMVAGKNIFKVIARNNPELGYGMSPKWYEAWEKVSTAQDLTRATALPQLKTIFGGLQSNSDVERFFDSLIGLDKDPEVVNAFIDKSLKEFSQKERVYRNEIKALEATKYQHPISSEKVQSIINELKNSELDE